MFGVGEMFGKDGVNEPLHILTAGQSKDIGL